MIQSPGLLNNTNVRKKKRHVLDHQLKKVLVRNQNAWQPHFHVRVHEERSSTNFNMRGKKSSTNANTFAGPLSTYNCYLQVQCVTNCHKHGFYQLKIVVVE